VLPTLTHRYKAYRIKINPCVEQLFFCTPIIALITKLEKIGE